VVRLVILAGGKASRMGQDKLALPWGKNTVLGTVLRCALETSKLLKTTTKQDIQIYVIAQKPIATYIPTDLMKTFVSLDGHWILSSNQLLSQNIYLGLENLPKRISGIGFLPGDQIGINALELSALIRHFLDSKPQILVPFCRHNGSPVIFHRKYVGRLKMLEEEQGGKHVLQSHPEYIERYSVSEDFLRDIDTPEDYRKSIRIFQRNEA